MPDYRLNVKAVVKLKQERVRAACLEFKNTVVSFLCKAIKRPLCLLQIFNIMAFHLLNLQIKW